jgi:hypothetical protein
MTVEAPERDVEGRGRWPDRACAVAQVMIAFDAPGAPGEDPVAHDISAAARKGDTLFLGADECTHIETLHIEGPGRVGGHQRTRLCELFELPDGGEEMDIEGLAVEDDWLWIVGSHSLTRRKPKSAARVDDQALRRLAKIKDNPNRMFVGRLPLARAPGAGERYQLAFDAGRRSQMLKVTARGSPLTRRLEQDRHLAPFLTLPAKENGLDIEGIVVDGDHIGLGLRGPVINGWALVLELTYRVNQAGRLKLKGELAKHWLDLGGLGIRDMKRSGEDVVLLAGPTMALDGPVRVFRWSHWRRHDPGSRVHTPQWLMDLPYGAGCDHPEALAPWSHQGEPALLVVCDKPGPDRLRPHGVLADVFG